MMSEIVSTSTVTKVAMIFINSDNAVEFHLFNSRHYLCYMGAVQKDLISLDTVIIGTDKVVGTDEEINDYAERETALLNIMYPSDIKRESQTREQFVRAIHQGAELICCGEAS